MQRLSKLSIQLKSISALVLTHAHFDHCGCAAYLRSEGVPVIASQQTLVPLSEGRQEGTSVLDSLPLMSRLFWKNQPTQFPAFDVDYPVVDSMDLSEFGIEGEVIATQGHTKGSVSVVLANQTACVGDLVMGGMLGLPPAWKPFDHPLSEDKKHSLQQMIELRSAGYSKFYVGHGDVLVDRHVDKWIESQIKKRS